jgi:hypothetical protein
LVADHEHVEVLVDGIDRKRARGICRGGQHVGLRGDTNDIGRVASAGALRVIRVDRSGAMAPVVSSTKPTSLIVSA